MKKFIVIFAVLLLAGCSQQERTEGEMLLDLSSFTDETKGVKCFVLDENQPNQTMSCIPSKELK